MQFRGLYVTDEIAFWAATGSNLVQSEIFLYRDDPAQLALGSQNPAKMLVHVWALYDNPYLKIDVH